MPGLKLATIRISCFIVAVLIAMGVTPAISTAEIFGDWIVREDALLVYAVSLNESGHGLGQFCSAAHDCEWSIGTKTRCDSGTTVPILANSDAGAVQLEIRCDGSSTDGRVFSYTFTNFEQVDNLVRRSVRIGFALPLQDDQFRVIRFDVRGSAAALSAMRSAAEKRLKPVRRGTRDERL